MFVLLSSVTAPEPHSPAVPWPHLFDMGCVCVISITLTCQVLLKKSVQAVERKTSMRASFPLNSTPNIGISTVLFIRTCWHVALLVILNHFEYFLSLLKNFKLFRNWFLYFRHSVSSAVLSVANGVMGDAESGLLSWAQAQLLGTQSLPLDDFLELPNEKGQLENWLFYYKYNFVQSKI